MFFIQALLQILDGLLTYAGVTYLGVGTLCEGNPVVRHMMDEYGVINGLLIAKTLGISLNVFFLRRFREMVMLRYVMLVVNIVYTLSAFHWIYILKDLWLP